MLAERSLHVGLATALGAVVVAFVAGVHGSAHEASSLARATPAIAPAASGARSYADEREHRYGPNAAMYEGAIARLGADHPGVNDPVPPETDEERAAALARRARRRAYDGAPPTIPHRIQQMAPPDCVACHRNGARIGDAIAPKISHAVYQSCVQCHVVASDPRPVASTPPPPENDFVGLASWGRGTRWGVGAPPTIPHPTRMRTDCTSCHGVFGAVGLRTPHPWRQSCTQCHVANAANDQLPSSGAPSFVAASLGPGGAAP